MPSSWKNILTALTQNILNRLRLERKMSDNQNKEMLSLGTNFGQIKKGVIGISALRGNKTEYNNREKVLN